MDLVHGAKRTIAGAGFTYVKPSAMKPNMILFSSSGRSVFSGIYEKR